MMSRKVFIGEHLRSAMKMRNISESELSRRTQLAQQLISKYRNNVTVPTATSLILMAVALDCSVDFLITGKEHKPEEVKQDGMC